MKLEVRKAEPRDLPQIKRLIDDTISLDFYSVEDLEGMLSGEDDLLYVVADTDRDAFEMDLTRAFTAVGKPILGICRGCQVLNVALGGDLWQDLPSQKGVRHSSPVPVEGFEDPVLFHEVIAVPGSPIARLFGERFLVNSIHHQACRTLGRGLVCDGTCAQDGIIEAFRHESMPWYGVQFHPEMMAGTPDDGPAGDFLPLFMAFVNEVRKDAARRASSAR